MVDGYRTGTRRSHLPATHNALGWLDATLPAACHHECRGTAIAADGDFAGARRASAVVTYGLALVVAAVQATVACLVTWSTIAFAALHGRDVKKKEGVGWSAGSFTPGNQNRRDAARYACLTRFLHGCLWQLRISGQSRSHRYSVEHIANLRALPHSHSLLIICLHGGQGPSWHRSWHAWPHDRALSHVSPHVRTGTSQGISCFSLPHGQVRGPFRAQGAHGPR